MDEALSPDRETLERVWKRVMPGDMPCPAAGDTPPPAPPVPAAPETPAAEPFSWELPRALMDLAALRAGVFRTLSHRGGSGARTLAALADCCQREFRQLSTACFLITGRRYRPGAALPPLPRRSSDALRLCWQGCQQWRELCGKAAAADPGPLLEPLYRQLEQEGAGQADAIRALLEQSCPPP